jgi:hypothetical protein
MRRYPFRVSWGLIVVGYIVLGGLTGLLLFGATRPGASPGGVPAILGLGAVMMLFPTMVAIVQLRNRGKAVVIDQAGIQVPRRLRSGAQQIAWESIEQVTDKTIGHGVKVNRSLFIRHPGGTAQILESDVGTHAFGEICSAVAQRARAT